MRVWFNHWFSQASEIIRLVKTPLKGESKKEIFIIGTHKNSNPEYKDDCDLFMQEPEGIQDDELRYLHWCLAFCKEMKIDVFLPYKHIDIITKNKHKFEQKGIKVLCMSNYDKFNCLNDKIETYKALENVLDIVPFYTQLDETVDLDKFKKPMCLKRAIDVGGKSYRMIVEEYTSKNLNNYVKAEISMKDAYEICKKEKLILMEQLDGVEKSIDCLITDKAQFLITRYKTGRHKEQVKAENEPKIIEAIEKICRQFDLYGIPFNVQFIGDKLLEINPRMAGGVYKSNLVGINIPRISLLSLIGEKIPKFVYLSDSITITNKAEWHIEN